MDKNNFGKKQYPKYQSQNEGKSCVFSIHYRSYKFCKSRKRKNPSGIFRPRIQNFANLKQGFTEITKKLSWGFGGALLITSLFLLKSL